MNRTKWMSSQSCTHTQTHAHTWHTHVIRCVCFIYFAYATQFPANTQQLLISIDYTHAMCQWFSLTCKAQLALPHPLPPHSASLCKITPHQFSKFPNNFRKSLRQTTTPLITQDGGKKLLKGWLRFSAFPTQPKSFRVRRNATEKEQTKKKIIIMATT